MAYGPEQVQITRTVSVRVALGQIQRQFMGQPIDELALPLSVRKGGYEETGIEPVLLLQPTGKTSIGSKRVRDGGDQEIDGSRHENDGMAGTAMLIEHPHGGGRDTRTEFLATKLLTQRLNDLRGFSGQVELPFAERVQRQWREMSQEPRRTLASFRPTDDTASPQPAEKSHFTRFARQNGIVDIKKSRNGRGETSLVCSYHEGAPRENEMPILPDVRLIDKNFTLLL